MNLNLSGTQNFISQKLFDAKCNNALNKLEVLLNGKGKGNDFLGWIDLPEKMLENEYKKIISATESFKKLDAVVIIGTGGSYLGARAIIEALKPQFKKSKPKILFAGHNLSADYHTELIDYLKNKEFGIVVISKSGTTTEPAIAFRLLYDLMKKQFPKNIIQKRIIVITDAEKGALRQLVNTEKFESFIIDDDIGGRYSVLSAVGLLPIAVAGYDIKQLLIGALDSKKKCTENSPENPAVQYAAVRNYLYANGYKIEAMVNYDPRFYYLTEWWKQLFGESEGKELKGIFPVSVSFTTDLHSLGQYIQQGERILFETVLYVTKNHSKLTITDNETNFDNFNYLTGKDMEFVNRKAAEATMMAHVDGKVPNIWLEIPEINEYHIGYLIYFFQIACGTSAYMLGVNPFDQPGVEDYKKNMFRLLKGK